jgi:hypothetical protein
MSTSWSRRITSCVVVLALSVITVFPTNLLGQGVQDGEWKVTSDSQQAFIYYNLSGSSQKVMVTVCIASGGLVYFFVGGLFFGLERNCTTVAATLLDNQIVKIILAPNGKDASGTYEVSVLP